MRPWQRYAAPLALAVALAAGLGTIRAGRFGDDVVHDALMSGFEWFSRGDWDLYNFAPGDQETFSRTIRQGPFPWWADPELKVRFLRPVSSLLLAAEWRLGKGSALLGHLHSTLWYVALVAVALLLYRRLLPARAAAIAGLLYALDDGHCLPTAYLANRHALVAAVPALLALWAHLRWREDRWRPGLPLSLLLFALGLAAGETALGPAALLVAYEVFGAPGPRAQRARALVPLALLGLAYVVLYRSLGFGARGSPIYVDPGAAPLTWLAAAPGRTLALLASMTLGVPSDLALGRAAPYIGALGLAGVLGLGLCTRALWSGFDPSARRAVLWLVPGALLSLAPALATFPSDRLLLVPSMASAALLGLLVDGALARARKAWRAFVAAVALLHGLAPAAVWVAQPPVFATAEAEVRSAAVNTTVSAEALAGRVVYLFAPDFMSGMYLPLYRRQLGLPMPKSWNVLSHAPWDHRVTRTDPETLELEPQGGPLLGTSFEKLFRDPSRRPFQAGDRVQLVPGTLTVLQVQNGLPKRFALRFDEPLEAYTLVTWTERGLEAFEPPAVGESVVLRRVPGPLEKALGFDLTN